VTLIVSLTAMLLFAAALFGWGAAASRLLHRDADLGPAYAAALGLAVCVFLGGILNAAHLATAPALWGLLAVGWALAAVGGVRWARAPGRWRLEPSALVVALPVALVAVFLAAFLMPAATFNLHDDFLYYIDRPVRMLATGTVGGAPLDMIGLDSLGGQALLDGFVLLVFPLTYLHTADAVFAAVLGLAVAGSFGRRVGLHPWAVVLVMVTYVVIAPQVVNISPVYSSVVLILALAVAAHRAAGALTAVPPASGATGDGFAAGLIVAALSSLKVTFVAYAGAFALACAAALLVAGAPVVAVVRLALATGAGAVVGILPWLAVHLPNYLAVMGGVDGGGAEEVGPQGRLADLWSARPLFWGASLLAYNVLVALVAAAGVAAATRIRTRDGRGPVAVVACAAAAGAVAAYLVNGLWFDADAAVRYAVPVLVAAASLAMVFLGSVRGRGGAAAALAVPLALVVLFGPRLVQRVERIATQRNVLSWPLEDRYFDYMAFALGPPARDRIRAAQDAVPAGAGLLAYVGTPFWLDPSRNPLSVVTPPGLANPWVTLPADGDPEAFRAWLHGQGIRYVIAEDHPVGTKDREGYRKAALHHPVALWRQVARRNLAFLTGLEALAPRTKVVYQAPGLVVLDTGPPDGGR
jgi:hypothetical protein